MQSLNVCVDGRADPVDQLQELLESPTLFQVRSSITQKKIIFCVEGNIAVGKSTLLLALERSLGTNNDTVRVIPEPVDEWRRVDMGNDLNLLSAMYNNTISASTFQLAVAPARLASLVAALHEPNVRVILFERSPWSERIMFANTNLNDGDLRAYNYAQKSTMNALFSTVKVEVGLVFIHLTLPSEEIMHRITYRNRPEEATLSRDYIERLQTAEMNMERALAQEGYDIKTLTGTVRHVYCSALPTPDKVAAQVAATIRNILESQTTYECFFDDQPHPPPTNPPTNQTWVLNTNNSLTKYAQPLTRSESETDAMESIEKLRSTIAIRSSTARQKMDESRDSSRKVSPVASPNTTNSLFVNGQVSLSPHEHAAEALCIGASLVDQPTVTSHVQLGGEQV
jgi:deoxyadenosine/deoxycytidine kinase